MSLLVIKVADRRFRGREFESHRGPSIFFLSISGLVINEKRSIMEDVYNETSNLKYVYYIDLNEFPNLHRYKSTR